MLDRRKFLETSSLVSLSPLLPTVFASTADAAAATKDERVLVVIQLDGGNDGLNTIVPVDNDDYMRARSKLRIEPSQLHKLDDEQGLHPSMSAAKALFDEGLLSIIQGVGYPNPDRSHFRSMKIWETASFDDTDHDGYGWLGRALDCDTSPQAKAYFIGEQETPVALWGRRSSVTALARADDLKLENPSLDQTDHHPHLAADSLLQFVTKQVSADYAAAKEFARQELQSASQATYPRTRLAERLKLIAQLLRTGSPARVYYALQSGYDTHSAQRYTHAKLLREFSEAIKAFLDDLKSAQLENRVAILAFSEFGRRVDENDSQGTDHGTAGPVFVAGGAVNGGLIGGAPNLADLREGDLKVQTDFRCIYGTLLDEWLGIDSVSVLGRKFDPLPLFDSARGAAG